MTKINRKVTISKQLYEKEAIFAAAHRLINRCHVAIEPNLSDSVLVTLTAEDKDNGLLEKLELEFLSELIDQQLRLDLERRYGPIRELIVKQAFSPIEGISNVVKKYVD